MLVTATNRKINVKILENSYKNINIEKKKRKYEKDLHNNNNRLNLYQY